MQTVECHLKAARQAIIHVLAGRSADGSKAHSYVVPYPHRHTHHVAPSVILAQVLAGLERVLSDDELTALTLKLLTYIARSPSGVMATCWRLDTKALCRVMKQRPAIITSRAGLAAILRSDEQEQAAQAKQKLRDDIKPRRVIATRQPYQLTETPDPQHLREDALRVGHCAATQFDKEFIASLGYQPKGREALLALTYWRRIVQGYMRIFSILQNGDPIVTIGYDIPRARIRDIASREEAYPKERAAADSLLGHH